MPIEALKLSLIQYIMETQDEKRLQRLYVAVRNGENINSPIKDKTKTRREQAANLLLEDYQTDSEL